MVKNKIIALFFFLFWLISCQPTDCVNRLFWKENNLQSVSIQPKVTSYLGKNYCGYSLDINRNWCALPMSMNIEDSFLKGDIFQIGDTIFLKSDNGKISPLVFWTPDIAQEYNVNSMVTSRNIDDNFTKGHPYEFDYKISRDTLFSFNKTDTIQRIRINNFHRYNNSGLVLVVSKNIGIEGIYVSNHKGKILSHSNRQDISHELIFVSDGNIYLETIPFAKIYDPKTMQML